LTLKHSKWNPGRSFEDADNSELLITPDESSALGVIDDTTARQAGINLGEVHVNVDMIRHAEGLHGEQIRAAGYKDALDMIIDIVRNFNEVRQKAAILFCW
jgi:hypothetical protein